MSDNVGSETYHTLFLCKYVLHISYIKYILHTLFALTVCIPSSFFFVQFNFIVTYYPPLVFDVFLATVHGNRAHFQCFLELLFQVIDGCLLAIQKRSVTYLALNQIL